jgi:hypothetical protein
MKSLTIRIDPCQLSTAVCVLRAKIQDIERQKRVYPDDLVGADSAKIRSDYRAQLEECLAVLQAPLDAWRANPS